MATTVDTRGGATDQRRQEDVAGECLAHVEIKGQVEEQPQSRLRTQDTAMMPCNACFISG
jgi:hypothetical protein